MIDYAELKAKLRERAEATRRLPNGAESKCYLHPDEVDALLAENERLRKALDNVTLGGHNDDCLFCARKDFNAQAALQEGMPA